MASGKRKLMMEGVGGGKDGEEEKGWGMVQGVNPGTRKMVEDLRNQSLRSHSSNQSMRRDWERHSEREKREREEERTSEVTESSSRAAATSLFSAPFSVADIT